MARLIALKAKMLALSEKLRLVAILVGNDPASQMYVALKKKRALEVGIDSEILSLPETISKKELFESIKELNCDKSVTGILLQLPLPESLASFQQEILDAISPAKDVDCLTTENTRLLSSDTPRFLPATVRAVVELLKEVGVDLMTSTMTIVGQGELVGYPLGLVMTGKVKKLNRCNSKTTPEDLTRFCKEADILVTATGKAKLITKEMVKSGAVVIDCGAPEEEVDFEEVSKVASAITPVPGGVGPMTVVSLLENTVEAARI